MTLVVTGSMEHWTAAMACLGAPWSIWRYVWNIGRSEWMVLCLHGTSWLAGRHLRVSIVRLWSLCNVCFRGPIQGVINQIRRSRETPPPKKVSCHVPKLPMR